MQSQSSIPTWKKKFSDVEYAFQFPWLRKGKLQDAPQGNPEIPIYLSPSPLPPPIERPVEMTTKSDTLYVPLRVVPQKEMEYTQYIPTNKPEPKLFGSQVNIEEVKVPMRMSMEKPKNMMLSYEHPQKMYFPPPEPVIETVQAPLLQTYTTPVQQSGVIIHHPSDILMRLSEKTPKTIVNQSFGPVNQPFMNPAPIITQEQPMIIAPQTFAPIQERPMLAPPPVTVSQLSLPPPQVTS